MNASVWKTLLKYGLGLGLLVWVIWQNWDAKPPANAVSLLGGSGIVSEMSSPGIHEMLHRPIRILPFLIAFAIAAVALLITFLRWHLLVRAQGLEFSRYEAIRLGLVGYYFNTFLPGSIGGDVIKAIGIAREQTRRTVAVATVLIDRAVGLWGLIWFVSIVGGAFYLLDEPTLTQNEGLKRLVRVCTLIILGSMVVWMLLSVLPERRAHRFAGRLGSIPKVGHSLAELWRAVWLYQKQKRAIFAALLLSILAHSGWVLVFHAASFAFDDPNSEMTRGTLAEHSLIVPPGLTFMAVFPTPGGVGGGEAAFGWLYSEMLHKPAVNGVLGCLSQRLVFWILGLVGAIIYARMRAGGRKQDPA